MDKKEVKKVVREAYGNVARNQKSCGSCGSNPKEFARSVGYSDEELENIPEVCTLALANIGGIPKEIRKEEEVTP